jgi:hypothetical protein
LTPITSSRTYAFTIEKLEEWIKPFVCINNLHITCKETKSKKQLSSRETIILVSLNEKIVIFFKKKKKMGGCGVLMSFI